MGAREVATNKGVGGYRPTVNWRDISIRRRNVAAKQVLACVILSGVVIIVVGIVITILGFLVIISKCPFEWEQPVPGGTCYYFAEHNATWREGKAYCKNQGATMLDLHSTHEKDFITERMVGRSWLGLRRRKDEMNFWWISGAKMNYTQWERINITAPAAVAECAMLEETGLWVAEPCEEEYEVEAYVICEYVPVYNPFVLIGPVVIFCGLIVLVLSIEICIRRKEFKEKNPEVMIDDEEERHVDAGLVNYGYGHFGEDPDSSSTSSIPTPVPGTSTRVSNWPPPMKPLSPSKSMQEDSVRPPHDTPGSSGVRQVTPVEDTGSGPMVHIVPASLPNSPTLATPVVENTQSQENLELLLSPKTLE